MVRRSLRAGLWLGLLLGMGWALRRAMLLRRVSESVEVSNDPWSPIAQPVAEPGPAAAPEPTAPEAAPKVAASEAAPKVATAPTAHTAATAPDAAPPSARTWVEPQDGTCPATHPIKVKLASGIYHLPGMLAYDRTRPDRCYANEVDAVADGFVKAKR